MLHNTGHIAFTVGKSSVQNWSRVSQPSGSAKRLQCFVDVEVDVDVRVDVEVEVEVVVHSPHKAGQFLRIRSAMASIGLVHWAGSTPHELASKTPEQRGNVDVLVLVLVLVEVAVLVLVDVLVLVLVAVFVDVLVLVLLVVLVLVLLEVLVLVEVVSTYGTAARSSEPPPMIGTVSFRGPVPASSRATIVAVRSSASSSFFIVKRTSIAPDAGRQVA